MEFITASEVRRTCGISSDQINDDDINEVIDEIESQVPHYLNTSLKPKERIDRLEGNDLRYIFTLFKPLVRVKAIKIGDSSVTINEDNIRFEKSGKITLDAHNGNPERGYFTKGTEIAVKYDYCRREETDTRTETTSDTSSGSSVTIDVNDESGFEVGDYVNVYGMDFNYEMAKVESTSTGQITVDSLVFKHESGSSVVKTKVHGMILRLLRIVASITIIFRMIGQTYTESTGYSLGELSVQKGVPYTHWQETAKKLIQERDRIYKQIKPNYTIL